ncbi:taurine dioxygenase [Lasius niger]|uniref:Taurine dioxygenase n=1 Tax=Lasius niger TaxID=67767 RepID=A0A0J7K4C6_LASNI|nr:taurine dioxygenase [Lasius niger]
MPPACQALSSTAGPLPWRLTPLTPAIGAQIDGLDLSTPLLPAQFEALQQALATHQVLFFRSQSLTPIQQRDFAAGFGPLHIHPIYPSTPEAREIIVLDTDLNDLRDNATWHTDVTFLETPAAAAVLHARVLPPIGGDTLWSSSEAAYQALSGPIQLLLGGLHAWHDISRSFPPERFGNDAVGREQLQAARAKHPPTLHPVIRTHPLSGRRSLFINEGFTDRIEGLGTAESRALLNLLFAHIQRPEFIVRWRWAPGDVAIWDNRNTQHYACDDYRPSRRVMHRATILGERPC